MIIYCFFCNGIYSETIDWLLLLFWQLLVKHSPNSLSKRHLKCIHKVITQSVIVFDNIRNLDQQTSIFDFSTVYYSLVCSPATQHLSSPPVFNGARITRSLVLCVMFCRRSLFVLMSFFFWPLIVLSVLLRFTDSDYSFGMFSHFLQYHKFTTKDRTSNTPQWNTYISHVVHTLQNRKYIELSIVLRQIHWQNQCIAI